MRGQAFDIMRFLAKPLAQAHPDRSLDLSLYRQRVYRISAVERCPDLFDRDLACGVIDADLDHLRGIGEAHGRADGATAMLAALGLDGCGKRAFTVIVPSLARAAKTTSCHGNSDCELPLTKNVSPSHSTSSGDASRSSAAAATNFSRSALAASIAALPTMKVTRLEYEPLSLGVIALSLVTTRIRPRSMLITSAAASATMVVEPWPMSEAPVRTVTLPSKSSFIETTACGSPVQWTGFAAPET